MQKFNVKLIVPVLPVRTGTYRYDRTGSKISEKLFFYNVFSHIKMETTGTIVPVRTGTIVPVAVDLI